MTTLSNAVVSSLEIRFSKNSFNRRNKSKNRHTIFAYCSEYNL